VVQLAAAQAGLPITSYSPREVKACVAGYGHASKHQMQIMVRAMLGMRETPEPADAADALAVALCHIHTARAQARFAVPAPPRSTPIAAAHGAARDFPTRRA
jgi:crossover junction endodeoxyribonuclease RuvC